MRHTDDTAVLFSKKAMDGRRRSGQSLPDQLRRCRRPTGRIEREVVGEEGSPCVVVGKQWRPDDNGHIPKCCIAYVPESVASDLRWVSE